MDFDWLHCNNCFRMKATSNIALHLTQCQHVLCAECLGTVCPVCETNLKAIKIDSSMPSSVKSLFEDFEANLERINRSVKFQWTQRSRLEAAKLSTLSRYAELQKEIKRMKKGLILLTDDANKEKYKLSKAKEQLAFLMRYKSHGLVKNDPSNCNMMSGVSKHERDKSAGQPLYTPFNFSNFKDDSKQGSTVDANSTSRSANFSLFNRTDLNVSGTSYATQRNQLLKGKDPDKSLDSGFGSGGHKTRKQNANQYMF